jgi:hypothetical protein
MRYCFNPSNWRGSKATHPADALLMPQELQAAVTD